MIGVRFTCQPDRCSNAADVIRDDAEVWLDLERHVPFHKRRTSSAVKRFDASDLGQPLI